MILVDSSCWLEHFAGSPDAARYASAIDDVDTILVSTINLYEVFRKLILAGDETIALMNIGILLRCHVVPVSQSIALDAAPLSRQYRLPLADSILLATARAFDAELMTQDAHFAGISGVRYYPKTTPEA